ARARRRSRPRRIGDPRGVSLMREPLHVLSGRGAYDSPLRRGVYILPNLVTTGGLFSGFYSMISTFAGHYELASVMILIAHVFDGLNGRIARLIRTSSRFDAAYDLPADLGS